MSAHHQRNTMKNISHFHYINGKVTCTLYTHIVDCVPTERKEGDYVFMLHCFGGSILLRLLLQQIYHRDSLSNYAKFVTILKY